MEINYVNRYGKYLEIKADNVNICEDVESRTYYLTEDGKIDYTKLPKRDVSEYYLNDISRTLVDMIFDRTADYDSSELISYLFDKLPDTVRTNLLKELNYKYE